MTPKEYKARYNNLKVMRDNGTVDTVRISRYVLNHSKWLNPAAKLAFNQALIANKIKKDLTIFTESGTVTVKIDLTKAEEKWQKKGIPMRFEIDDKKGGTSISTNDVDWAGLAAYCFLGKGAPEHCQLVLQLAERFGLAPNGLQAYADSALGLDCNGFVGNYIWHGKRRKKWSDGGFRDGKGPDARIDSFFFKTPFVKRWEDINPANTYLLGMVDKSGQIIPGGGGPDSAGHIMISQPGMSSWGHFDTYSPRLWVVESTAGAIRPGLAEGWYECVDYDKTGVFNLERSSEIEPSHREIRCRIVQLTV